MRIVLDTNVLLVSISSHSKYHWIYQEYLSGNFTLCVTGEILLEYEEVITIHMGKEIAAAVIETIINNKNTILADVYYKWNLIEIDKDDNKFVDAGLAANVLFIVSEDRHFDVLKKTGFPKIEVLNIEEFRNALSYR